MAPETSILAGKLNGGFSGALEFDAVAALDDRLTLHPTASVNGNVFAGLGTDTLAFGGSGTGTFNLSNIGGAQQFRDFEVFQVESGVWSFSGATTEDFTVNGGTLKGTGTFGSLTVIGGTVAPGNSIGTMTVNGAFTLGGGAVYEVEVNAAGQNDKVIVNGTVNLTGATLSVLAASGNYRAKTDYTIIENDGTEAVVGTFASVTSSLAFLIPTVVYNGDTGNDVVLTLERNSTLFSDVAQTRNQRAVAGALDQFPTDNALFLDILNQTAAGARQAFDALSGEIHASVAGMLADDSRYVREAVLGRLVQATYTNNAAELASLAAVGPQVASLDHPRWRWATTISPRRRSVRRSRSGRMRSALGRTSTPTAMPRPPTAISAGSCRAWMRKCSARGAPVSPPAPRSPTWMWMCATLRRRCRAITSAAISAAWPAPSPCAAAACGRGVTSIPPARWCSPASSSGRARYDADTGQLFGEAAYPMQMWGMALEPFAGLAYVSVDTRQFPRAWRQPRELAWPPQ